MIAYLGARPIETRHGAFTAHALGNHSTGKPLCAVAAGDLRSPEPLLARVHSSCMTSETLGGLDCDCADQLDGALARIAAEGRGVVFYLVQEGRGAGFSAKARDRMIVQASENRLTTFEAYEQMGLGRDQRRYDEVALACRLLGVRAPLRLMTNNPEKIAAIAAAGVSIAGSAPLRREPSPFNAHYLAAKQRSGHSIVEAARGAEPAELPERVESFEPYPIPGAEHVLHVATYLLPLGVTGDPVWFRLRGYRDRHEGLERVALAYGDVVSGAPLVRFQMEALLERFSSNGSLSARRAWEASARAIVRHGSGCAVLLPPERAVVDSTSLAIVRHTVKARRIRPLGAGPFEIAALARLGYEVAEPAALVP